MPSRAAWGRFGLGALVGAPLACSVTFGALPALGFAFPLGALALLERAPGPRAGFATGWGIGFGCNVVAFHWIVGLLETFARFPTVAAIAVTGLLALAQGLLPAFACWLIETAALGTARPRRLRVLALPVAITAVFSLAPTLFPWRFASSAVGWLEWAQMAELGGPPLLDLAMLGAGAALYLAATSTGHPRRGAAGVAALLLAAPAIYGAVRLPQVRASRDAAPPIRVGVVQPNIAILDKHDRRQHPAHLRLLRAMTSELEAEGAPDLTLWPETAYPFPIRRGAEREPYGRSGLLRDGVRGPLLVGAITQDPDDRCGRWNSALAIDREGRIVGVSDKVELLAFGETVPLHGILPPLRRYFPCPGLRRGHEPGVLTVAGARVGVLNCYEDVLAEHARAAMRPGSDAPPELLVNLTNDAWFGDGREPHLHQLVARGRAIETRRDLVRAVNTGVSSHVDATGHTVIETPTFERARFVADARRLEGETFWVRHGDLVTPACLAWLFAFALAARRRLRYGGPSWRS